VQKIKLFDTFVCRQFGYSKPYHDARSVQQQLLTNLKVQNHVVFAALCQLLTKCSPLATILQCVLDVEDKLNDRIFWQLFCGVYSTLKTNSMPHGIAERQRVRVLLVSRIIE
jgi:hypothetical protein